MFEFHSKLFNASILKYCMHYWTKRNFKIFFFQIFYYVCNFFSPMSLSCCILVDEQSPYLDNI